MKHAGQATLDRLEPLLADLRSTPGLVEKQRGVFYRKGRAFLHFHEDSTGMFGDIRDTAGVDFDRIDITEEPGRTRLLEIVRDRAA